MNTIHIYTAALYLLIFCMGACVGSYLNVVAYRLPLGMSTVLPASHCPHCKSPVPLFSLIPVIGYLFLKGRCFHCREPIPILYPIVESLTGVGTCLLVYFLQGDPVRLFTHIIDVQHYLENGQSLGNMRVLIAGLWLFYTAIPLSLIDLKYRILPDKITLPGIAIGFGIGSLLPNMGPLDAGLGILMGGGFLYAISKFYEIVRKREGMGLGDVKYLAMIGSVVGWEGTIYVIVVSSFLGAAIGILYGLKRKSSILSEEIPFGPFLAIAGLIVFTYQNLFI